VPRVADEYLGAVVFIYPSVASAEADQGVGGTGFLLGVPFQDNPLSLHPAHAYVVTARHVLHDADGHPYPEPAVVLGLSLGRRIVIPTKAGDWRFHPGGDDIGVAALPALSEYELVDCLPSSDLLTEEVVRTWDIGIGTDVFLAGRYQPPNGVSIPTVRFGNISHTVIDVSDGSGQTMSSYLVEGRSRGGFSGSAVVVRSSVHATAFGDQSTKPSKTLIALEPFDRWILGVHWGYASEFQEATIQMQRGGIGPPIRIDINEGIMFVAPAWRILEVLNSDGFREERLDDEGKFLARRETQRERE
jgi:hypothetical protein